jgi:hypothetical protein
MSDPTSLLGVGLVELVLFGYSYPQVGKASNYTSNIIIKRYKSYLQVSFLSFYRSFRAKRYMIYLL